MTRTAADRRARWQAAVRRESRRFLLLIVVVAGALCGLTVVVFEKALDAARHLFIDQALDAHSGALHLVGVLLIPAVMGALLGILVPRLSPEAGGGLTLVRTAYGREPSLLDMRALLGTFGATPLSLGAGVPLGPEGPTVVLTSGVAAGVARFLGLPSRVVRGMIPVGAAAGIAAIFNTPITGVVFALEEVIGTASRGVLGGAIVAAVAAAVVHNQALGGEHLLPAAPLAWKSARELVGFALVGLVSGATAGLLPKAVIATREALNQALSGWGEREHVLRGVIGGLAVGAIGLLSPESLGIGYKAIANWLAGGGNAGTAAVAFVAKFLGVTVALASSLVGGVFAPALFLGASLGAATGHLAHLLSPQAGIDPGAYALVGMGAFFAGFLRTPIASVLIVFELTGDYSLVAPLMLAVALSSLIAPKISPSTLVERQLEAGGIASLEATSDPLSHRRVRDAMTTPVVSLDAGSTLLEAWAKAEQSGHRGFPIVDPQGLCTGIVDLESLEAAVRDGRWNEEVLNLMRSVPVLATPDEPLDRVFLRLGAARETRCPVVESLLHPKLVGFLAPSDFLRARVRASVEEGDAAFEPLGL